jgi:hypothetical protein
VLTHRDKLRALERQLSDDELAQKTGSPLALV